MRRGLERAGDLDTDAARFSTQMMLDVLPYVVGKKVGAPDGSTVVLALTGPIVTTTTVATTDGRAHPLDAAPEIPTVAVSLASDVYARLACGRTDPDEAVVTGAVAIEGDVELGGALVRELNYMF
jgi:putative sterol carrier protein